MSCVARKERPIIFSGPMVRAILEGRKTQTRRVVKPQPEWNNEEYGWRFDQRPTGYSTSTSATSVTERLAKFKCPYGAPGDRLWVREAWADLRGKGFCKPVSYRADTLNKYGSEDGDVQRCRLEYGVNWKPSIHMPRWASRITLEVTVVRRERLQEISEADAVAEGIERLGLGHMGQKTYRNYSARTRTDDRSTDRLAPVNEGARYSYRALWDTINGKKHPWASNPWVWVIEFKSVTL